MNTEPDRFSAEGERAAMRADLDAVCPTREALAHGTPAMRAELVNLPRNELRVFMRAAYLTIGA